MTVEPVVRSKPLKDWLEIKCKEDSDEVSAKITRMLIDHFVKLTERSDYPGPKLDDLLPVDDFQYLWAVIVTAWLPEDEGELP